MLQRMAKLTEVVLVILAPETAAALRRLAGDEQRSVSAMARLILVAELSRRAAA